MCGGRFVIAVRSDAGVSPVRTSVRMFTSGKPRALSSALDSFERNWRFRCTSLLSAFSGET